MNLEASTTDEVMPPKRKRRRTTENDGEKPKLVSATADPNASLQVDWESCFFCQEGKDALVCPDNNVIESRRNLGYISLASNLEKLKAFRYILDCGVPVEKLDEGGGILETFKRRKAKWHKKCVVMYLYQKFEAKLEQEQKKIQQPENFEAEVADKRSTRASDPFVNMKAETCFLCKGPEKWNNHLTLSTSNVLTKIRSCAETLCDSYLQGLLSNRDLLTEKAKYHKQCLVRLYRKITKNASQNDADADRIMCEGMAFADVILYIHRKLNSSKTYVFELGKLMHFYRQRLSTLLNVPEQELGKQHETRFREKILARFPELKAEKYGREYTLMLKGTNLLTVLDTEDQDEDALAFQHFAKRLRGAIAACKISFNGSFEENCEESCVPASLLGALNILLYGSTIHEDCRATKPVLSICQLIILNYRQSMPKGQIVRNARNREPPLPLYIGLSIYGKGREKSFIDEMHRKGLSVSSNKIMEVTSQLCRLVVERSKEVGVLCPSNLKHDLFTVSALDNIDHKTSSTTSRNEFHGTSISVFQLTEANAELKDQTFHTSFLDVDCKGDRSVPDLPDFYSNVPECILPKKVARTHKLTEDLGKELLSLGDIQMSWENEAPWLLHVHDQMAEVTDCTSTVSWGAFHASLSTKVVSPAINAILPLFHEKATDPSMLKHGMKLVKNITQRVNSDQIPVMCVDQQLYCLCKYIQWQYPEEFGEESFVIMLGPLHIEKSFLAILGQYLEDSGWIAVMANSGVINSGSAEGLLKVSNIMKARAIHQVTACALHSLLVDAYDCENPEKLMTLQEWINKKSSTNPNFKYWYTLLNLQILELRFVRSIRDANFKLYKTSMKEMLPWYFLFDHQNYARWLPVHLGDMVELEFRAPSVNAAFESGKFVVPITGTKFTALGIDHAHEQNNARIKGKGGAIGLTENPSSLRRYTIGSPEVSRLLGEFEGSYDDAQQASPHHEQYSSFQLKFLADCAAVKESFVQCENPFRGDNEDLANLSSRVVLSKLSIDTLNSLVTKGKLASANFVQERLVENKTSLHEPIKKANVKIFGSSKNKCQKDNAVRSLKSDVQLFMRLFIVSTARNLDLSEFFKYENQKYPPALSLHGEIRPGNKADLLTILEKLLPSPESPTQCQGLVVDGAGLVHLVKPSGTTKTLSEYCSNQLCPILANTANSNGVVRVDVAWDLYSDFSIKGTTRNRRGSGVRQKDIPERGILPKNWEEYLKNSKNKMELFSYIAQNLAASLTNYQVVTNVDVKIKSSPVSASLLHGIDISQMEEADGRIFLHIKDMIAQGLTSVLVRCSDTDVVVIGISHFHQLQEHGLAELWFLFGNGAKKRYIPIHAIAEKLGREKAVALRGWHGFTGCDSTSFFASKGKRSGWSAWKDDEVTAAFKCLALPPSVEKITDTHIKSLEAFTNKMYDPRSECNNVNEARRHMFVTGEKTLSLIPPTAASLLNHIKRTKYQAGEIWGRALESEIVTRPPPEQWGWKRRNDNSLEPDWTQLDWIWEAVKELDRCGCRSGCDTNRCSCRKNFLACTPACKVCHGDCHNTSKDTNGEDII